MKIPYAIRDFEKLIRGGYTYLDRTNHIPVMEDWGYEILVMRPRRFGKSLWLSTLMNYYDLKKADVFDELFGDLAVGQAPTPLRNAYLVMRWDFSRVAAYGSFEDILDSLNSHINSRAKIFQQEYRDYLTSPFEVNEDNALASFDALVNAVRFSGHKLYLFIDEYDNFANELMMASSEGNARNNQERYEELVKGEGLFKTFFKNVKSAGSGDGLDRIFMTGVSPIVLNDVSSGANTFENVTWEAEFNTLCGFTKSEVKKLIEQVVADCELPDSEIEPLMTVMHNYYNGSCFVDDYELPEPPIKVYNPTSTFYFLKHFQRRCAAPRHMIDENLAPDETKLAYIAGFGEGKKLLENALQPEEQIIVETVRRKFSAKDLFNPNLQQEALAVLLYYLGGLTSVGSLLRGPVILDIPNLIMRKLYAERILAQLTQYDDEVINAGRQATDVLFAQGEIEPLCRFVETNLLPIYSNRDSKSFNELTLKTLFITLLHHTQMYLIDSEPEIGRRYGDLLMLVRPGMRKRGLYDILIEFKHVPLNQTTEETDGKKRRLNEEAVQAKDDSELKALEVIQQEFTAAKKQLTTYRQKLTQKYADDLVLKTYAVVSIGFGRILWEAVE